MQCGYTRQRLIHILDGIVQEGMRFFMILGPYELFISEIVNFTFSDCAQSMGKPTVREWVL